MLSGSLLGQPYGSVTLMKVSRNMEIICSLALYFIVLC